MNLYEASEREGIIRSIEESWRRLWPSGQRVTFDWSVDPAIRPLLLSVTVHNIGGWDYRIEPAGDDRYRELVIEGQDEHAG